MKNDKQLHIAMVVRNFSTSGGLELYTHKLVEGLLAKDLQVTVICANNASTLQHPNLDVRYFKQSVAPLKVQRLLEEFDEVNKIAQSLDSFDLWHSQHQPMQDPDVVTFHNHTVEHLSRVGYPWEKALNNIKGKLTPAYRKRNDYDRILFQESCCCVYTSEATRDDFVSTYSLGGKGLSTPLAISQVVAYPGADLAMQLATVPARREKNTFLFVGRGYRKKGLDVLISACGILKRMSIPFKLLIAGLRLQPLYAIQLNMLDISNEVEFLGFQDDMDAIYRRCSFLAMPSRVEPFGMAAVQAMQYGIVPIVSKVSGISEILTDRKDALILQDQLSAPELASLMSRLLEDQNLTSQLAQQAQITARGITWDKTVEATLAAYQLALQRMK